MTQPKVRTISWRQTEIDGSSRRQIVYRGALCGPGLRLHYGFDGWQEPTREVKLELVEPGLAVAEPTDLDEHLSLEGVVTDGTQWDNNSGADYRLWLGLDPLDSHLHVSGRGSGELGIVSLQTAMA